MCVRGVWQLKKLHLQFCDHGGKDLDPSYNNSLGSSKGVREFLESDLLKEFVKKNPQIEFKFLLKRGTHPFITSTYVNGYIKDLSLRNKNPEEIIEEFKRVRNSSINLFTNLTR
jgi:Mitochondrial ribosomal protein L51 / S25 / CI-B8 domain.